MIKHMRDPWDLPRELILQLESTPWGMQKCMRMGLTHTELTFSGLRRMRQKKEFGRIYSGLRTVKRRRRFKQREKMAEDAEEEGRDYSTGICLRETM